MYNTGTYVGRGTSGGGGATGLLDVKRTTIADVNTYNIPVLFGKHIGLVVLGNEPLDDNQYELVGSDFTITDQFFSIKNGQKLTILYR